MSDEQMTTPVPLTSTELQKLVAAERLQRVQACLQEMQTVLVKHGCELYAVASIAPDGRIVATAAIRIQDGTS